jgi:hypothetical protein
MQKWSYFSMGIMAGIIAVLLTVVVMQNREPLAHASTVAQSVDNTNAGLMMGVGASQQNQNDIVWVVYKRPAPRKAGADSKDMTIAKDERITLACYQIGNGARQMKLAAVRDISFDLDVLELANDRPHVKDIIDEIKKTMPKPGDKEK